MRGRSRQFRALFRAAAPLRQRRTLDNFAEFSDDFGYGALENACDDGFFDLFRFRNRQELVRRAIFPVLPFSARLVFDVIVTTCCPRADRLHLNAVAVQRSERVFARDIEVRRALSADRIRSDKPEAAGRRPESSAYQSGFGGSGELSAFCPREDSRGNKRVERLLKQPGFFLRN